MRKLAEKVLLLEDSNELGFSMSRYITILVHSVASFGDDLAIHRKESTEWVIALAAGFLGQIKDSAEKEAVVHKAETNQRAIPNSDRPGAFKWPPPVSIGT